MVAVAFATALLACANPPPAGIPDDAGSDAGPDSGVAPDGGVDAGLPPGFDCDPTGTAGCDAGQMCLLASTDAGLLGKCRAGACDVQVQDCGGGQRCEYRDGGRTCIADGTLDEGQLCGSTLGDCKKGMTCLLASQSDGGVAAVCTKFCRQNGNCTSPQICGLTTLTPAGSDERPVICAPAPPTCDYFQPGCPQSTDACYPQSQGPRCFNAGNVAVGATCAAANDCVRGAMCSSVGSGGLSCRALCSIPAPGVKPCDAGTCLQLAGTSGVGVCN